MQKLWAGRFSEGASSLLDEFNASIMFDRELYKEDIEGSIAHTKMLSKVGIIAQSERDEIIDGLLKVKAEIDEGSFIFSLEDEDIHMAIEKRLIELIGDSGKKVHTARSRNDQVALDFRLYTLRSQKEIEELLRALIVTLLKISKEHTNTLIPGMTHLQHAQPINFAFHLLAYVNMFKRDIERLKSSCKRNNVLPLGCAALAGTPYASDREFLCKELGFDEPTKNCLDSVSDRDFALEALFNISMIMMHISRISEELILWSSYEFKFVTICDKYSTGSSIMPQKKNPDVPELLRGKSGRVYGNLISLLTVMKGLPLAYNKDTQEDKEGLFDSVNSVKISLKILNELLKSLKIEKENMESACKVGHLSATDLADYLVKECKIPFREAHFITGKAVAKCEELGVDLSEVEICELQKIDSRIKEDVLESLDLRNSMNARDSQGGTSVNQTQKQILEFEDWLKSI